MVPGIDITMGRSTGCFVVEAKLNRSAGIRCNRRCSLPGATHLNCSAIRRPGHIPGALLARLPRSPLLQDHLRRRARRWMPTPSLIGSGAKFGIWSHWGPQSGVEDGDWFARNMYIQGTPQYEYHLKTYGHPSKTGYKDLIPLFKGAK